MQMQCSQVCIPAVHTEGMRLRFPGCLLLGLACYCMRGPMASAPVESISMYCSGGSSAAGLLIIHGFAVSGHAQPSRSSVSGWNCLC